MISALGTIHLGAISQSLHTLRASDIFVALTLYDHHVHNMHIAQFNPMQCVLIKRVHFIFVHFFSISPFCFIFPLSPISFILHSFILSFIHPFILFPIAFKYRQPLSNAKQINNNLFVTNDCHFTHLNKIASYVLSAMQGVDSHALIHKTKVVCKIYSYFALTHVKVAACIIYMQTNKTKRIQFIPFRLKIERIQHTNVTISLHHFNCLFMIFTYFICLLDVLWFIFVCLSVRLLTWIGLSDLWDKSNRNGMEWHGMACYNKQTLTLTILNAHIFSVYTPLNANI